MHFVTLVAVGVLFIAAIASAQYNDILIEIVKMIMCDPDPKYKEMRDAMESCSTDQELSSYIEFFKYCGIELSSLNMTGMTNYYCNTAIEDIKRDNECISKKIKEMGKKEEMTKRNEPVEGCVKAAIEARRKK